jgi:hypothetical protein
MWVRLCGEDLGLIIDISPNCVGVKVPKMPDITEFFGQKLLAIFGSQCNESFFQNHKNFNSAKNDGKYIINTTFRRLFTI